MAENAELQITLDLAQVQRQLSTLPDMTAAEAKKATKALAQSVNRMAKAAETAAKNSARETSKAAKDAERKVRNSARAIEREYNEQFSAIKGLSGAVFGSVATDAFDVADSMGTASAGMAGLGAALGALAIAPVILGGIFTATKAVADAALEARDALEEEGLAVSALVPPASLAALVEYETAQRDLANSARVAQVVLGARLAPELTLMSSRLTGMIPILVTVAEKTAALGAAGEALANSTAWRIYRSNATLGLSEVGGWLAKASEAASDVEIANLRLAESAAEATAENREMLLALGMVTTEEIQAAYTKERLAKEIAAKAAVERLAKSEAQKVARYEEAKATKDAIRNLKDETKAVTELWSAVRLQIGMNAELTQQHEFWLSTLEEESAQLGFVRSQAEELTGAYERQRDALDELGKDEPGPWEGIGEDIRKAVDAATHFASVISDNILGGVQQLAAQEEARRADNIRGIKDEKRALQDQTKDAKRQIEERFDMEDEAQAQQAAAEIANADRILQSDMAKLDQREAKQEEQALKAWKTGQKLAISMAIIDAARNAVVLTGAMAYLGPLAPATAASIAAAGLGIQLALIRGQEAPTFHTGSGVMGSTPGIAGQVGPALLEDGEAVVSRRGMATAGAADIIRALERNELPDLGPAPIVFGDDQADILSLRQNRPYAPAARGRAMVGTRSMYGRR